MHDDFYADMLADFRDRGLRLVAVNEGGRWYVSPSMTMVEQTLGSDRRAAPRYDADFTDVEGASSPEEAVSGRCQWVVAMSSLNASVGVR